MFEWKLLKEETARQIWDENLKRLPDCSPFQTFSRGQFNRALGWQPRYFAAFDENGEIAAMCLGLLRQFPFGVGLLWCVGGLVGDIRAWDENFRRTVLKLTGLKHLYFRFRCDRERNIHDVLFLSHQNWTKSAFMMTSGLSLEVELSKNEEKLHLKSSRSARNRSAAGGKSLFDVSAGKGRS